MLSQDEQVLAGKSQGLVLMAIKVELKEVLHKMHNIGGTDLQGLNIIIVISMEENKKCLNGRLHVDKMGDLLIPISKKGCLKGCFSCFAIFVAICTIFVYVYTFRVDKHLYYSECDDLYVQTDRNSSGDSAYVYLGKTKEDIQNKSDYFVVRRDNNLNYYFRFALKKNSDSVFLINRGLNFRIGNSTNFIIIPHIECRKEVKLYDDSTLQTYQIGHLLDEQYLRRFKQNTQDYVLFYIYWNEYWHEGNHLWRSNEFPIGPSRNTPIAPL